MPKEIEKNLEQEKPKPIFSREPMKFPEVDLGPNFLSPEAFIMLFIAGLLDLIGLLLLCLALDDFWITDIVGLAIIGSWMFLRIGYVITARKVRKRVGKSIFKRLGLAFLIEIIPWLGGLVPAWTLAVYFELKNNPSS